MANIFMFTCNITSYRTVIQKTQAIRLYVHVISFYNDYVKKL